MLFRRNVFVLGAGFSADAGAPVMRNFLQKAKHLLDDHQSGLADADREAFTGVFEFLRELRAAQAKITLDLENIEHLFGLAEMDLEFGGRNRGAFRRVGAPGATRRLVGRRLLVWLGNCYSLFHPRQHVERVAGAAAHVLLTRLAAWLWASDTVRLYRRNHNGVHRQCRRPRIQAASV